MADPPDPQNPTTPMADAPTAPSPPTDTSACPPGGTPRPARAPVIASALRLPSYRASALLAGVMLAIGLAVGAAIGPAPNSSFAGTSDLPLLLRALSGLARAAGQSGTVASQPPITPQATPTAALTSHRRKRRHAQTQPSSTPSSAVSSPTPSTPSAATPPASAPTTTRGGRHGTPLPPITNVWLIELSGPGFAQAQAQPSAAPYIDGQATPGGTLLSDWSALDGSAYASEAALLASTPPQLLDTIAQPPCPEGAAGAQCAPGTPGGLSAADEFLKQTVPMITASEAYRTHGLIVVTFGSIASAAPTGLPAGAAPATLTSQPPTGVLLISPFASAGMRSSTTFHPASPKRSLEKLLHQ
jgi:hypothetical protein